VRKLEVPIPEQLIDEALIDYFECIEKLHESTLLLISEITQQSQEIKQTSPSLFISIVLLERVAECLSSIKLLILFGQKRDAAILILNLIELRLDLLYISLNSKNADEWLDHSKEHTKPWKVSFLFRQLYSEPRELEAEQDNYKRFSMVKHGNPLGGIMSFPIEITNRALLFNEEEPTFTSALYLYISGVECHRICNAAIVIAEKIGYQLENINKRLTYIMDNFQTLYDHFILSAVDQLIDRQEIPELCKNCVAIPKGKIEISCLVRRGRYHKQKIIDPNHKFLCDSFKST
jgi:hypothetical protein